MKDNKLYERVMSIILLVLGVGGLLVSLTYAIPAHGLSGFVAMIVSICTIILGLDKDT